MAEGKNKSAMCPAQSWPWSWWPPSWWMGRWPRCLPIWRGTTKGMDWKMWRQNYLYWSSGSVHRGSHQDMHQSWSSATCPPPPNSQESFWVPSTPTKNEKHERCWASKGKIYWSNGQNILFYQKSQRYNWSWWASSLTPHQHPCPRYKWACTDPTHHGQKQTSTPTPQTIKEPDPPPTPKTACLESGTLKENEE